SPQWIARGRRTAASPPIRASHALLQAYRRWLRARFFEYEARDRRKYPLLPRVSIQDGSLAASGDGSVPLRRPSRRQDDVRSHQSCLVRILTPGTHQIWRRFESGRGALNLETAQRDSRTHMVRKRHRLVSCEPEDEGGAISFNIPARRRPGYGDRCSDRQREAGEK